MLAQGSSVYTWDAANRLVSANVDGVVSSSEYDGLGNRTAQTVGGVTTEYVLDVAADLPEVIVATTGGASMRYVQVQGQIRAEYEAGVWAYVLPDHLGSVRQLMDANATVTLARSYEPYGSLLSRAGTGTGAHGFTGEWTDGTGLVHLRARYYAPQTGIFLSKDPAEGEPPYLYERGNPVNFADPPGLCPAGQDCDSWIDLIEQRFGIAVDRDFMPDPEEISVIQNSAAYQFRDLCAEENLWSEYELATVYLGFEMLQTFLGSQFNHYITGASLRRVHNNTLGDQRPLTEASDPRDLGLPGPVIELTTGSFHDSGGNGNLKVQGETLHIVLHESFHIYILKYGFHILRDFGQAAGWSISPDLRVRWLSGCWGSWCDPTRYRSVLVGTSSQRSKQALSSIGHGALHEDFAETSAQFAEIWLKQNGVPLAEQAYNKRQTYELDPERALHETEAFKQTLDWLENHYGRQIQTTYPRTP